MPRAIYEKDPWEIDLGQRQLRWHRTAVPIGGRAFELIEVLVESTDEIVTKRDLMARVWPGLIVEDNTLQVHIAAVRRALGADRGLLKTLSGRGISLQVTGRSSRPVRPEKTVSRHCRPHCRPTPICRVSTPL